MLMDSNEGSSKLETGQQSVHFWSFQICRYTFKVHTNLANEIFPNVNDNSVNIRTKVQNVTTTRLM